MKVTIFGSGYVGLVTGACLAECGNHVVCVDTDKNKIAALNHGEIPIFEPGLEEIVKRNGVAQRLHFTTDLQAGVAHGEYQFIAVGTPAQEDGAADLSAVYAVAKTIASYMDRYRLVVNKSTVPVGTVEKVEAIINTVLAERQLQLQFDVVSNPEFLKQGAAVHDFMHPDRVVVGANSDKAMAKMRELYAPIITSPDHFIAMDASSSELTKYAANAFLATKISFINEISQIAERLGADIEHIRQGISLDPRISHHFLNAGCGYGGSCFPKDVSALRKSSQNPSYEPLLLKAVETVNQQQKVILFTKIQRFFNRELKDRVIALWGLAFKPNTDDMREAPSRILMESLWRHGAKVQAYDPAAMDKARQLYHQQADFKLCQSKEQALENADVLAIVTEWDEFRSPEFSLIKQKLNHNAVFDGRNIYDIHQLKQHGIKYYAIGRGDSL